jgi:hypothetical protein
MAEVFNSVRNIMKSSSSTRLSPMRRIRFTIAQLMAAVLVFAFCFAALTNANAFWGSAAYTLAIVMLAAAVVGAIARKGRRRINFAAFAVFGWTYLLVSRLPSDLQHIGEGLGPAHAPILLFESAIEAFALFFYPAGRGSTWEHFVQVSHSIGIILFASVGAVLGHLLAAKDQPPIA